MLSTFRLNATQKCNKRRKKLKTIPNLNTNVNIADMKREKRYIHKFMACLAVCNCSFCVYWKRLPSPFNIFLRVCIAYVRREESLNGDGKEEYKKYKKEDNKRMWKIAIAGKMINWQFLVASIARAHHIKTFMLPLCDTARGLLHLWVWHERWIETRGIKGMCAVKWVDWRLFVCERFSKEGQTADIERVISLRAI
jgi:hypothetical protein